jgi:hypothetical protein
VTELTPYAPPAAQVALADHQTRAVQRLTEWAQSARAAHAIAQSLVQTSFVPAAFRGKPEEATAAILAGAEVGLQPMAALKSFDVIQGQAAPRAIALRAIVQSYGHEMVLVESTATRCRMKGLRRGSSEWQTVTWTIDRAKEMQLTGKDNWKKQPGAMLVARATGELARLIAADAILGIGYAIEEIADGAGFDSDIVEAAPAQTRKMSRPRPAEPSEAEPEADEEPVDERPADDPNPDLIDPKGDQMKALQASFRDAGISSREDRLRFASETIAREIGSAAELTRAEASAVIDELKALTVQGDEPLGEPS